MLSAAAPDSTAADDPAGGAAATLAARQVENLDRGIVAVRSATGQAFVSWRLLGLDPAGVGFNVYRSANGAAPVKLNAQPLTGATHYTDTTANFSLNNAYSVRAVVGGVLQPVAGGSFRLAPASPVQQFLSVPIQAPAPVTTPDGAMHTYEANDASVGDLDGDGQYEIVLKWVSSSDVGSLHNVGMYLDAYEMDGTRLWRAYSGKNVKTGAQFMQFVVYDFDGDGKAEVAFNSSDGAVTGTGQVIGDPSKDWRNTGSGWVETGPEFLTLLDGPTGRLLANTSLSPARGTVENWGDDYGHRAHTFNAGVAYVDGERPSLVFGRGIYHGRDGLPGKTQIVAWDWRNGALTQRWTFTAATNGANPTYVGQGNHNISVGDVDADGKDEVVWGSMTVDDNGAPLYSTRLGHGDAMHMSDMVPGRPGLEVFAVHESPGEYTRDVNGDGVAEDNGGSLRDARTGQVLVSVPGGGADVGRGLAMDIHPRPGYEMWTSAGGDIWNVDGTVVAAKPSNMFTNFGVWWDGDLYRELLDRTTISKWDNGIQGRTNFDLEPGVGGAQIYAPGASSNNDTKATPALSGDILGDWREEVIWRTSDSTELRIFTTVLATTTRLATLMHDPMYRVAVAGQQNYYNQPPHPSFFLGNGMSPPPAPNIQYVGGQGNTPPTFAVPPSASPNPVTGTTANLSVLGADAGGEANLTYTWAVAAPGGPAPVTFTPNGTNAARNAVATFTRAGTYTLTVTAADAGGLTTSGSVVVTVAQTPTGIAPAAQTMAAGTVQQISVTDQFGQPTAAAAGLTWSSNVGVVSRAGVFTAPAAGAAGATITATDGAFTANTSVAVVSATAWYRANQAAGPSLTDSSGSNKHGSLSGAYNFTAGKTGNALLLTGGHATLPGGIVSSLGDFTIAAWVYLDANATWSRVFDFGSGTGTYMFLTANAGGANPLRFAITTSGGGGEQQINAPAIATGGWRHVAVTLAGSVGTLYVDGVAVASNANMTLRPSSLGNTTQNYLGKSQYNDPAFAGKIDDFRIYGTGLPPAAVESISEAWRSETLPAWVAPGSAATWDAAAKALAVTGPATIVADPAADAPLITANGTAAVLTINPAAGSQVNVGGLQLSNNASALLGTAGAARVLVIADGANLTLDATAALDLGDNAVIIRNANSAAAALKHTSVNTLVRNAFHDFAWDLPGITSSTAAAHVAGGLPSTLGVLLNDDGGGGPLFYGAGGDVPQFMGVGVDGNTVMIRFTRLGDGNLDGAVDTVDFALFQAGYTGAAPYVGFAFGDYDYNGVTNTVDFGLFQAGYEVAGSPSNAVTDGDDEDVETVARAVLY